MSCSRYPRGGWYPSKPCRFPGPHPGGKLRGSGQGGGSPGPHLGGVCSGGGGACSRGPALEGDLLPGGVPVLEGACSKGGLLPGGCGDTPGTATAAGGTHPTGMHSGIQFVHSIGSHTGYKSLNHFIGTDLDQHFATMGN